MDILTGKTYTKKQIAEKLHVTVMTINNYIKAGKLEAVKIGNSRVLITEESINRFIQENIKTINSYIDKNEHEERCEL